MPSADGSPSSIAQSSMVQW